MNRIVLVLLLGFGLQTCPALAQNAGVPQGSKFQPVITDRMLREGQSSQQRSSSTKPKSKVASKSEPLTLDKPVKRAWTDEAGKLIGEATFVELKNDQVTLQKSDGKRQTISLSSLGSDDQLFAKTESRVVELREAYSESDAPLQTTCKKLIAEKARLDAKKNKSRNDLIRDSAVVDEQLSNSTEIRNLKNEYNQKIRKLYNEYSAATGEGPSFVEDGSGKLESRDVLTARDENRKQRQEVAKVAGTARLAADSYITALLGDGVLREADFQSEEFVTPGPKRDSTDKALGKAFGTPGVPSLGPMADPTKWKAVYFRIKYKSREGLLTEKDAYVLTCRKQNARVIGPGAASEDGAVWAVEGLYVNGELVSLPAPKRSEQTPQPSSNVESGESTEDENQMRVVFKDWANQRGEALKKAAKMPKQEADKYIQGIDKELVKSLTQKYKISHQELDRIEAYGAKKNWW